jgi:hypothetical protein
VVPTDHREVIKGKWLKYDGEGFQLVYGNEIPRLSSPDPTPTLINIDDVTKVTQPFL